MWSKWHLNSFFFQKITKIVQQLTQTSICVTFELHSYCPPVTSSPNLNIFGKLFNFWLKFSPFNKTLVTCQPRPGFWSSILRHLCPMKRPSFRKLLMASLHVICGLPPSPQSKSWLRLYEVKTFFSVHPEFAKTCDFSILSRFSSSKTW